MKKYYKFFILLIVISFIIPQIAFASWWNPFSWGNNKNSAKKETGTQTQQTTQNASDQSAIIEQLKKTIAELEKQLNEYKCPACVGNNIQCPECKPQIITKEVPVEKIVYKECTAPVVQAQIESGVSQLSRPNNNIYIFQAYGEDFAIKELIVWGERGRAEGDKLYSNINAGEDKYVSYFSKCVRGVPTCYYLGGDNPYEYAYLNMPRDPVLIPKDVKFSLKTENTLKIKKIRLQGVETGKIVEF